MTAAVSSAPARRDARGPDFDEPAFGLDESTRLRPSGRWSTDAAGGYLARAIARDPTDLRRHVQRISVWTRTANGDEVFGAMIDLFLALGDRGAALRGRMLQTATDILGGDQCAYLSARLVTGLTVLDPHPPAPASVLTRAVTGRLDAVVRRGVRVDEVAVDALSDAREYLSEGNFVRAREILEAALGEDPARSDIGRELVAIYRHSRDAARLETMRRALGDRLADPEAWDECLSAIRAGGAT